MALGDKLYNLDVKKAETEKKLEAKRKAWVELKKSVKALAAHGDELEKQLTEAHRFQKEAEEKTMTA